MQSADAQSKTVRALKAMNAGQWDKAQSLVAETRDPIAAKIYYWMLFMKSGQDPGFVRMAQFVRANPHWPDIRDLRIKAELSMAKNASNAELISWFNDYKPITAQGLDTYVQALLLAGQTAKAKKYLAEWWSDTLLSRKDQQFIYSKYKSYLTKDAHRKRFDTLLFAGYYKNAKALAPILGNGYRELADARIALANEQGNVNALIQRVPAHLQNDTGLIYERLRWRRRNDLNDRAIEILMNMPPSDKIENAESWWRERHIIARRLIEERRYNQAYSLVSKHIQKDGFPMAQAEWLAGFLALRLLDKPTLAYQHFETLYQNVETPISMARGAYWAGKSAEAFGQNDLAQKWYENAARFQTVYYGQLAGARLGQEKAFSNARPPELSPQERSDFQRHELVQASRLFFVAGMNGLATDFLMAFVEQSPEPKAYRFAAEMASEIDHQHTAVRIAKKATKDGMFLSVQSYPVIASRLTNVDVEWALVHALIRQESLFDFKAQSPVGALGLMQLMPATAKEVAGKLGIRHQTHWLTSNPDHNIRLGSEYMEGLLARFDGAYPMAIAAYNAGPGRVNSWIKTYGDPRKGEIDWIDWIELIPIYETRNYVQRVLEGVHIYRLRLKDIQKTPVAPIHISMIDR